MSSEKIPSPGENENRDKTSHDIIKSCFGDQDSFEAVVFGKRSQIENRTGKRVKVDKKFTSIIFEDYPDKKLLENKITILTAHIRGILKNQETKNFGMDTGKGEDMSRVEEVLKEKNIKDAYAHEKRNIIGVEDND